MNCGNCGSKIEPGRKFCGVCGAPVPDEDFGKPIDNNQMQVGEQSAANAQMSNGEQYVNGQMQVGAQSAANVQMPNGGQPVKGQAVGVQPPYMYQQPQKKKSVFPLIIGLIFSFIAISVVIFAIIIGTALKSQVDLSSNSDSDDKKIKPATFASTEEVADSSDEASSEATEAEATVSEARTPTLYTGPLNYYQGKWVLDLGGVFFNYQGLYNVDFANHQYSLAQTADRSESLIFDQTEGKIYYMPSDLSAIQFATDACNADIAHFGGALFYVRPITDDGSIGNLYYYDTATGKSELIAERVISNSPCISPDGKTLAYTVHKKKADELYVTVVGEGSLQLGTGAFIPYAVSNGSSALYFINTEDDIFCKYNFSKDESVIICTASEINRYLVNKDITEVVVTTDDYTYYCGLIDDEPQIAFHSKLASVFTEADSSPYAMYGGIIYDIDSFSDVLLVSASGDACALNTAESGFNSLPQSMANVNYITYSNINGTYDAVYAANGKLYRATTNGANDFEETVLFEDFEVYDCLVSYDHKDIWFLNYQGDLYYFTEETGAEKIDSGIDRYSTGDSFNYAWSVDTGYIYYTKDNVMYRAYNSSAGIEKVMDNVGDLDYSNAKIYFITADGEALYIMMGDEFVQVG